MSKYLKIFKRGDYGEKGDYTSDTAWSSLVDGVNTAKGILYHTSRHLKNGLKEADIPVLAEWELKQDDNFIYGKPNLTEKGKEYLDGIDKVSIEVGVGGKLTAVGMLPNGIKPHIKEVDSVVAAFEADGESSFYGITDIKEFDFIEYEGGNVTAEEILAASSELSMEDRLAVVKGFIQSFTNDEKSSMRQVIYGEFEETPRVKTEEELRAEIKAELQAEVEKEKAEFEKNARKEAFKMKLKEFYDKHNEKMSPAMRTKEFEAMLEEAYVEQSTIEFEEKKINVFEVLSTMFDKAPKILNTGKEFENNVDNTESAIEKAYNETKKRYSRG